MIIKHLNIDEINGSLVVLDHVKDASAEEMVELRLDDGTVRTGRIVKIDGERITVQVFEGTRGISMSNVTTTLMGKTMEVPLSPEILGRTLDGLEGPLTDSARFIPTKKET